MNKKRWIVQQFRNLELNNGNPGAWAWAGVPKNEFRQYLTRQILKPILTNKKPKIEPRDLDNYIKWVVQDGYIDQDGLGQLKLSSKGKIFISKWYDPEKVVLLFKSEGLLSKIFWLVFVAILVMVVSGLILEQLNQSPETKKYTFAAEFNNSPNDYSKLKTVDCWTNSLTSNRPDAYRCSDDRYIYDPCFSDETQRVVVCPTTPDSLQYFNASFGKDVVNRYISQDSSASYPWQIKLYDGSSCYFEAGATDLVAGMRMDYICDPSNELKEFLLLPITTYGSLEKIGCFKNNSIQQCDIKEAWY